MIRGQRAQEPLPWDDEWVDEKLAEMRVRFGVPWEFELFAVDIQRCIDNATNGILPEWRLPSWYQITPAASPAATPPAGPPRSPEYWSEPDHFPRGTDSSSDEDENADDPV